MRRAGRGVLPSGDVATWVVAEGRRGRRWRESVAGPAGLRHALLLETAPDGRFLHLELATPAGLLTLHPEGDGTLHGNAVAVDGVRHVVAVAWQDDGCVLVDGSAVATAAAVLRLRNDVVPGASTERTVLHIDPDLRLVSGRASIARPEADTWQVTGSASLRVDAHGLPRLPDGASWPLEVVE